MAGVSINHVNIGDLLESLRNREWLVPKFQREFLWSIDQIKQLIYSIVQGYPIGMITLWAQPDESALELEPLLLLNNSSEEPKYFSTLLSDAKKRWAILDGRQRSTSIAMAFGGFKSDTVNGKYSGKFFLNVATINETERIEYFKDADLKKLNMVTEAEQIAKGYFPLFSTCQISINEQWMNYLVAIRDPKNYQVMPDENEISRRDKILRSAFNGIIDTRIAIYTVSEKFDLGQICEVFETLNTTGTKVSTVDLIHSWLYSDTIRDVDGPILLRDWIQEMSERSGSIGWADASNRPELMAQISTACYITSEKKASPRYIGGRSEKSSISSIKASDLLATPKDHWKVFINHEEKIADYLSDFQEVVAGGKFPWTRCPYPATAAIYVGLRWNKNWEDSNGWGLDDLNALFSAFFWRNSLTGRYDQGFLTQVGTDIKELTAILKKRKEKSNASEWVEDANKHLDKLFARKLPDLDELRFLVSNGKPGGALQKSLHLLLHTLPKKDILNPQVVLNYPNSSPAELHHIYPRDWCKNNKSGEISKLLDAKIAGQDWVNSTANLMLLSRDSNNAWKSRIPSNVIEEWGLNFTALRETFESLFIDEELFELLKSGPGKLGEFWSLRANKISKNLFNRMFVSL